MHTPCLNTSDPAASAAGPKPLPGADVRPRRRKLHELPAPAQDLLLALSFVPATLRDVIEKALSRMRGQPVRLLGTDADLLYSAMHDLAQRNPLSEALHRRLEARHVLAVRRLAPLRDGEALRQAWLSCLQQASRPHEDIPAMLWALLTHPQGATQEVRALAEARTWVFAQARQGQAAADRAAAQRLQDLQAELARLQQRLQQQHTMQARDLQQAGLHAASLAGEARRCQPSAEPATAQWAPVRLPRPSRTVIAAGHAAAHAGMHADTRADTRADARHPAPAPAQTAPVEPADSTAPSPSPVQGRRVLCVGGIQHAVARYRSRIETLGGRFEHHDGGLHDNAHALDGRLARADLVICQAGCINHAAYHRIKQHCQRTGTPCLYLARASLSRFDRALQGLHAPTGVATERPAEAGRV